MLDIMLLIVIGIISGIITGLFGLGGGFLMVPLLYYVLPHSPYSISIAVATSLAVMLVNSLFSSYKNYLKNNIVWMYVPRFFYTIIIGSMLGAYINTSVHGDVIRYLFIAYLACLILYCVFFDGLNSTNYKQQKISTGKASVFGIVIGTSAGALGIGGGTMLIPLLRKFGLTMQQASATSNLLALPNTFIATIVYTLMAFKHEINLGAQYVGYVYLHGAIILVISGFIGVPTGQYLASRLSEKIYTRGFVLLLTIAFFVMLLK